MRYIFGDSGNGGGDDDDEFDVEVRGSFMGSEGLSPKAPGMKVFFDCSCLFGCSGQAGLQRETLSGVLLLGHLPLLCLASLAVASACIIKPFSH